MNKYKLLTEDTITVGDRCLYRIQALRDFANVKEGEIGGYIEKEDNLSQEGNCWVFDNAWVFGSARVSGNARVCGDAQVFGSARVCGDARVSGRAWVSGDARVSKDPIVITGLSYVITKTDHHIQVGCKLHSFEEWREIIDTDRYKNYISSACKYVKMKNILEGLLHEQIHRYWLSWLRPRGTREWM